MLYKKSKTIITFITSFALLSGCQSIADKEQHKSTSSDLLVKGVVFSMDVPFIEGKTLAEQQDHIFTSINERKGGRNGVYRYIKNSRASNITSTDYYIKSGLLISSPTRNRKYDTFLEYKLMGRCENKKSYLQCKYHAISGRYVIDLPPGKNIDSNKTDADMEEDEIDVLSKLNFRRIHRTKTIETPYTLEQIKGEFIKKGFTGFSFKDGSEISVHPESENYNATFTQQQTISGYLTTINITLYAKKISPTSSNFITAYNEAIKDIKAVVNK